MENTKSCSNCGAPLKLVPAGISKKTNRPYNSFYSCDSRNGGCGKTEQLGGTNYQKSKEKVEVTKTQGVRTILNRLDELESILTDIYDRLNTLVPNPKKESQEITKESLPF